MTDDDDPPPRRSKRARTEPPKAGEPPQFMRPEGKPAEPEYEPPSFIRPEGPPQRKPAATATPKSASAGPGTAAAAPPKTNATPSGSTGASLGASDSRSAGNPPTIGPPARPTTGTPDARTTTGNPDARPTTGSPDARPTTGTPDARTTTGNPDARTTTGTPDARTTTDSPHARTTTGSPDARPTTGTPDARTTIGTPDARTTTGSPHARTTTGNPDARPTTDASNSNPIADASTAAASIERPPADSAEDSAEAALSASAALPASTGVPSLAMDGNSAAAPIAPELTAPVDTSAIVVAATPPARTSSGAIVTPSDAAAPAVAERSGPSQLSAPSQLGDSLPASYDENELRAAVGVPPKHVKPPKRTARPKADDIDLDDDGDGNGESKKGRRLIFVAAASVVFGLGIAAAIFIGRNNSERLMITCEAKQVIAERGRAFPPWGERRIGGDQWRPIEIPPDFICMNTEVESVRELGDLFRIKLVERADAMLLAGKDVDKAAAMLEQALLHARTDDTLHTEARKDIKQRLGDVRYWRASAKLKEATAALEESAKEFETAALEQPVYAQDSTRWADLLRRVTKELQVGPAGVVNKPIEIVPVAPEPDRPTAPPGVALPVEPGDGSTAGSTEVPVTPPDAGVPTGGVLL